MEGKDLPVYGDGKQVRDWLYVEDHARALVKVAKDGKIGETYNVGGFNEKENIEVVRTICSILDEVRPRSSGAYADLIKFVKDRPGHDLRYAIDARKWNVNLAGALRKLLRLELEKQFTGTLITKPGGSACKTGVTS